MQCQRCAIEMKEGTLWQGKAVCHSCFREMASGATFHPAGVPSFISLNIVGATLRVSGVLSLVAGIAMALSGNFGQAGISLAAGVFLFGVGEGLECLRMITINSFLLKAEMQKAVRALTK